MVQPATGSSASGPTTNAAELLRAQAEELEQLKAQVAAMAAPRKKIPVKIPENYDGGRSGLKTFLTNVELYCRFNQDIFDTDQAKILAASMHLEGKAAEWLRPLTEDYLLYEHDPGRWDEATKKAFTSWGGFKDQLQLMFGEVDEEKQAERQIQRLKQTKSAGAYTGEFRQLQAKISWDDAPLQAAYYNGLKETVKDELTHHNETESLEALIELAVRVDNRLYERQMEKRGSGKIPYQNTANIKRPRKEQRDRDGDIVMADKAHEKRQFKKKNKHNQRNDGLSDKERQRRFDEKACLGCGQQGHFKRDCPGQNKLEGKRARTIRVRMATLKEPDKEDEISELDLEELQIQAGRTRLHEREIWERLSREVCWVCASGMHWARDCREEVCVQGTSAGVTLTLAEKQQGLVPDPYSQIRIQSRHRELGWYQCYKEKCQTHQRLRDEACKKPGDYSHKYIPTSACKVATCYLHHEEAWKAKHLRLGWTACYDDYCNEHRRHKHANGWWPQGPLSGYTSGISMCSADCGVKHDMEHQDVTHWKHCETKCFTHLCAREEDAADPSSDEHKDSQADECVVENCEWHGQDNTRAEIERLDKARAMFDKLYAECGEEKNPARLWDRPEVASDADNESEN